MIDLTIADLAMFACAGRDDWDRDDMTGAVSAARNSGWTWERLVRETARLMCDPQGSPKELRDAVRSPLDEAGAPAGDDAEARDAARSEARAELARALIERDQRALDAVTARRAERDELLATAAPITRPAEPHDAEGDAA